MAIILVSSVGYTYARMLLVERHITSREHPLWEEIDSLAFKSKNLYNLANYHCRQQFFAAGCPLSLTDLYHKVKGTEAYNALPTKVSKQIIRKLTQNWTAYFAALKEYRQDRSKFQAEPRIPKYKHKTRGRNILIYPETAYFKKSLKKGIIKLSRCNVTVPTKLRKISEVRIVPRINCYVIEVVYEQPEGNCPELNPNLVAGIDLGVNNLAAITSNKRRFQPLVVNGKPLKSINQGYNKRRSHLQSILSRKTQGKQKFSRQLDKLTFRRNCQVDNYLHHTSRLIVDKLVEEGIGTLVIGKNDGWKQESNLGKKSNQDFVNIPHAKLIEKLTYKAQLVGIQVIVTEESYTSKASALDLDKMPVYGEVDATEYKFSGRRLAKKRGLYKSKNRYLVSSDCNGSLNIIRKVIPNSFEEGIEVSAVIPVRLNPLRKLKAAPVLLSIYT